MDLDDDGMLIGDDPMISAGLICRTSTNAASCRAVEITTTPTVGWTTHGTSRTRPVSA